MAILTKIVKENVELTQEHEKLAKKLESSGLKPLDALHVAFASISEVDYFCTCDDRLLRNIERIDFLHTKAVTPTQLVMELDV